MKKNTTMSFPKVILIPVLVIICLLTAVWMGIVLWLAWGIANGDTRPSRPMSDAATIDNSCKSYYADIMDGYSSYKNRSENDSPLLPKEKRREFALSQTIGDALEYMGTKKLESELDKMVADTDGNIYHRDDPVNSQRDITIFALTEKTTLGELYGSEITE